ncbi:MAG: tRNA (guanine(46)-N(7))-methyltransferase TrmB [Hyphomicrobiales bacterium]|nr:tRNA (guanine(46)-N(7))-methyltransferase TrmB [Hyphomicrobiales bacterium]
MSTRSDALSPDDAAPDAADESDVPPRTDDRFYGRRRGRKLKPQRRSAVETLLPRLRLDLSAPPPEPLAQLFDVAVSETWLEIGFGGGEHLAEQAGRNPDVGFIGAEPFVNGVAKLVSAVGAAGLGNVRIHDDDARPLLAWLPDAAIARAFILFPDPWPKRRHGERRIVSAPVLAQLARVMRPGATLSIASDIEAYIIWARGAVASNGGFLETARDTLTRPSDWAPTRYEEKALAAGRICRYCEFVRLDGA